MARIAVIHTTLATVEPITRTFREIAPEYTVVNMLDDSLLTEIIAKGAPTPGVIRRWLTYAGATESQGVDLVLSACSSISEAVPLARQILSKPVLSIDEPMVEEAVSMGKRVAVLATLPTTLVPTSRLLLAAARQASRDIEIMTRLCEGAFDAARAGRTQLHDDIIRDNLRDAAQSSDVVILAQASMARAVDGVQAGVPVLSSMRSGVARACEMVNRRA